MRVKTQLINAIIIRVWCIRFNMKLNEVSKIS